MLIKRFVEMNRYKNTPNKPIKDSSGKTHWSSRSVAVVSIIVLNNEKILLTKRGPKVTSSNLWCNPCGYLDWDESATEAIHREIWEETGLEIDKCNITLNHLEKPYNVITDPTINQFQDVILYFGASIKSNQEPTLTIENCEEGETLDVKWVPLDELSQYQFAFNHDRRIKEFLKLL